PASDDGTLADHDTEPLPKGPPLNDLPSRRGVRGHVPELVAPDRVDARTAIGRPGLHQGGDLAQDRGVGGASHQLAVHGPPDILGMWQRARRSIEPTDLASRLAL